MADTLQELFEGKSKPWISWMDPTQISIPAKQTADEIYGRERSGGRTDALRHLLGAAVLTKRQGPESATAMLNWHENPKILNMLGGGYGQPQAERLMDLHNNTLGMHIGTQAKTYDELVRMAQQFVDEGRVRYAKDYANVPEPVAPPQKDYIDSAINGSVDLVRRMFSK